MWFMEDHPGFIPQCYSALMAGTAAYLPYLKVPRNGYMGLKLQCYFIYLLTPNTDFFVPIPFT